MTRPDALTTLAQMPAWSALEEPRSEPEAASAIESACARLSALDDIELREVVARYLAAERDAHGEVGVDAASRVYVLIRYVYAAPARAERGLPRYGAFAGIPSGEARVDETWPWVVVEGQLELVGAFGGYFGDEYLALQELDAFRDRFGRRESR
ncbi:hypothetical protein [Actinopolymorpha pittospori]